MPTTSCRAAVSSSLLMGCMLLWALTSLRGSLNAEIDEDGMQSEGIAGVQVYEHHAAGRRLGKDSQKDWMLVLKAEHAKDKTGKFAHKVCLAVAPAGGSCLSSSSGFASVRATKKQLDKFLKGHGKYISFVEADSPMSAIPEIPSNGKSSKDARKAPPGNEAPDGLDSVWGIDRIDAHYGYDNTFNVSGTGAGVHVYVFDSGIRTTHQSFGGRAIPTLEVIGNGVVECHGSHANNCALDVSGHGTHCAGTIGSSEFGVARDVTLHAVKILKETPSGNAEGSWSWFIQALDWVKVNAQKPALISASLQSPQKSKALRQALESTIQSGVTVLVAAGNDNKNACNVEPARISEVFTVGATTWKDERASYSNYGSCLDMFAPGSDIWSAGILSDTTIDYKSGTSMATPHVAGAAALVLQRNPLFTPKEVMSTLKVEATRGVITDRKGSDDLFLYVGKDPCTYEMQADTAIKDKGTGGQKRKLRHYATETEYLNACRKDCNADSKCKGFVDDPTDKDGRQCKPKKISSGYSKKGKTLHLKGIQCLSVRN